MAKLPPLNALKAFEAAARHGGFVGASEELHVTRGAISRHVKLLEAHLGVPLFVRQAQGVRLTAAGLKLLPVVSEAFGTIARAAENLSADAAELRIICPPGTSIRWLLPRLEDFRTAHPEFRVRLTTDFYPESGFDPIEADIGFSVSNWPNRSPDLAAQPLFPTLLTPACAPRYLRDKALRRPEALAACELLHETRSHADWTAWTDAFRPAGVDPARGQDFPNIDIATKAAVMGVGVVMADLVLCREELDAGTLVAPFPDMVCPSPLGGICLLAGRDKWQIPKVAAFRSWADAAAAADRAAVSHLVARAGG
ncbi:LysR substrate-binding domain-containing protein [Jannaschia seohaensis]|uniref:LysR family glycine cleavage system transcriptional activator/LysR family transcriptional regulator of beta-lactamase n=1 Tax=Jannaschia seohaensis TaxID=475081 RepID=A0A2Y9B3U8_9RHOB|nr:LysR substrate-binding domain-containing protein [Jannaschia seohaensis]PWJ12867.1 LysR family glycine cleavage system transcriptional activator/LysR family transcriptional regulator of beta-lactamase [Jannaschia seohaensis]SSA50675.1 LysR family transcriptional regulator, glycine cleavage system transcriptional activator/LysR family transcriptional regulator, regulator of gene expression of beta-lactamase [Jannaschia seohaensis]